MIHPRVRTIDLGDLDDLPSPCRGCMFWQAGGSVLGRDGGDRQAQDAWWRAVQLDWGTPGKGIWDGDELVAFALYAPPDQFLRSRSMTVPASDDAVLLATMWCEPGHRGGGLARHLLQVVARDAMHHGVDAVEAYGAPGQPEGACVVPAALLESLGFSLHRPHPSRPLYRMSLDRTVSWPSAVGHALGEVLSTLQGRERARSRPALEATADGSGDG